MVVKVVEMMVVLMILGLVVEVMVMVIERVVLGLCDEVLSTLHQAVFCCCLNSYQRIKSNKN